jgi:hypothetical protein
VGARCRGLQLAPSVEGRWWVNPARPGYGAAAQPIAGKPAPTRTAYGLEWVRYLWRAISYETRSPFVSSKTCENSHPGIKSLSRRSIGDATLAGRNRKAHQRPVFIAGAFFCARDVVLWRWCAGHLRVCRAPFVPVGQPAYCCHLNLLGRERWQFHHERNSCMTTVSPLLNLASDLLRRSSTILSYFNVSPSRFVSAQSEARHD